MSDKRGTCSTRLIEAFSPLRATLQHSTKEKALAGLRMRFSGLLEAVQDTTKRFSRDSSKKSVLPSTQVLLFAWIMCYDKTIVHLASHLEGSMEHVRRRSIHSRKRFTGKDSIVRHFPSRGSTCSLERAHYSLATGWKALVEDAHSEMGILDGKDSVGYSIFCV